MRLPCVVRDRGLNVSELLIPFALRGRLSVCVLCGLQAKPSGLLKPLALGKLTGRYLAHQEGLPCLPVPPLQQTLDRYLLALQPIISEEEWTHTKGLVDEFRKPGGVGERLQKGLERRARKTENWVCGCYFPESWSVEERIDAGSEPSPIRAITILVSKPVVPSHWHLCFCDW